MSVLARIDEKSEEKEANAIQYFQRQMRNRVAENEVQPERVSAISDIREGMQARESREARGVCLYLEVL
jgi:hypothetical protein